MDRKPKVTILCTTYNHERFLRRALDGFVMQKADFPFEVIVHDDASTDGTQDIIREYQRKYPDIIVPILQKENQFSQGKDILMDCMYDYIRGEYVALNEGDDYWTDELKLQKQVDFLDAHPDYSICFHPVRVEWEENMTEHHNQEAAQEDDDIYPSPSYRFYKTTLELSDLLKYNFIQTNSVMYRWALTREMWPRKRVLPCDHLWHLMHAMRGKIGFLPDVMAVYHRHSGGIWTGVLRSEEWHLRCAVPFIRYCKVLENLFGKSHNAELKDGESYDIEIKMCAKNLLSLYLDKNMDAEMASFYEEFPDLTTYVISSQRERNVILEDSVERLRNKVKCYKHRFVRLYIIIAVVVVLAVVSILLQVI